MLSGDEVLLCYNMHSTKDKSVYMMVDIIPSYILIIFNNVCIGYNPQNNHLCFQFVLDQAPVLWIQLFVVPLFQVVLHKEAAVLIVCDIPYGITMLRKLLSTGHPHWTYIELRKMAPERLQDIITTTPRVVLASLASWVEYEYSLFNVDYLIIMDAIIDPTVDLDLEQTKLIQLITLHGVDNYVYDHGCVEYH